MKQDIANYLVSELGLSEADVPDLYESFLGSYAECVKDIRALSSFSDFMEIRRITHTLIGFSQNVGATDLYEASRALNLCAKAEDVPGCERAAQGVIDLYNRYMAEKGC